ncbi:MAG: hypothetical protein KatS3mg105_0359 [Gemmatales bacterium]|nr:MAG: hypothetical protein KatS3mg105_0359 [Gemmatales bacterium]
MRICLFEDHAVELLEPLSLTRPAFELLCGQSSLAAKQCRYFAPCEAGVLIRPYLTECYRLMHPRTRVNDLKWLRSAPVVLVNARWLPPATPLTDLPSPVVGMVGDEVAYAVVAPDRLLYCSENTIDECLLIWKRTLPHRQAGGKLLSYLWEFVDANGDQLVNDFESTPFAVGAASPEHIAVVGSRHRLRVDPTAQVEPLVVADTANGPVVIDAEAKVSAFSRLEGPCYIGPGSHVLGAKIRAGTTIGPDCRIGGEVEASIIQGHSNKYHDGFLGHSYLGEWINLGAGTNNSDLRNDYGPVSVHVNGAVVNTGQRKVGCFMGDHTKTGLGTLLNTGSNVGVSCNLLPTGYLLPKFLPSFTTWWNGEWREVTDMNRVIETARTVMQRRGRTLCEADERLFQAVYAKTSAIRERARRDAEQRRLRRSA